VTKSYPDRIAKSPFPVGVAELRRRDVSTLDAWQGRTASSDVIPSRAADQGV